MIATVTVAALSGGAVLMVRVPRANSVLQLRALLLELGDLSDVPLSAAQRRAIELVGRYESVEDILAAYGAGRARAFNAIQQAQHRLEREREIREREQAEVPVASRPISDLRLKTSIEGVLIHVKGVTTIGDLLRRNEFDIVFGGHLGRGALAHIKERLWKTAELALQPAPPSSRELRMKSRGGALILVPTLHIYRPTFPLDATSLWPLVALSIAISAVVLGWHSQRRRPLLLRAS